MNVQDTLDERGADYGPWPIQSHCHHQILRSVGWSFKMPDELGSAVYLMAMKISRMACGNSKHRDSVVDIAGYARLVEQAAPFPEGIWGDGFLTTRFFPNQDDKEFIIFARAVMVQLAAMCKEPENAADHARKIQDLCNSKTIS